MLYCSGSPPFGTTHASPQSGFPPYPELRLSRVRRPALGALLFLAACKASTPSPPAADWHEEPGGRWRELNSPGQEPDGFTRLPGTTTGIDFSNTVSDSAAQRNRHLMDGSGVAIGDVNGDGRPDLYLCRIEGPNALYLNQGNWRFREAARESGVALDDRASTGAVLADLDGDGDLDLIVTAMGGRNSLFLNDGQGRFSDGTAAAGFVAEARGSTTATLADVEGDGDLDLYIANYKTRTMLDSLSPVQRSFDQLVRQRGSRFEVIPERQADYRLKYRKELNSVSLVQRADPDWFYLNDGSGHFVREPLAGNPRFRDQAGKPLTEEPEDFGLAARFYDVNGDGAPDLYVANDFEDPDQFWINDGTGRFRLIAKEAIRRMANSNMAVDFADLDRDGAVDLFAADMLAPPRDTHRRKTELPTHVIVGKPVGFDPEPAQWQRNVLLRNRGDGTFAEIADAAGVAGSGWSWTALFLDVDLDGYEDLLVANGHTWDLMDGDAPERLRASGETDWRQLRRSYPPLSQKNLAFRNRGDWTFEDVGERWRFGTEEDISHGMAAADFDGDGDLDLVINRLGAAAAVLRNDAAAPRIAVRLRGKAPNTSAIGAKVRVLGGPVPVQEREMTAGGLYLSSSEPLLSFASGKADSLTLEVLWRGGTRSLIDHARPNRLYEIQESEVREAHSLLPTPHSPPLFEDVSPSLGDVHRETVFNDYVRQPLLDYKLSQLGPGVSWIDLDGDERDDLVIPAGPAGELAWYRNAGAGGRFTRVPLGLRANGIDFTAAVGLPASSGRGQSLLVGRSNYRAGTPEARLASPVVSVTGSRNTAAVPADSASVGPLALADVDGDGELDLFTGGRVLPGMFPVPPSSHVYLGRAGRFVVDSLNDPVLRQVGMVSAAVFTDVNGDGWPDLALALDWGPVKLLLNDHGRLRDATELWGLSRWPGGWKGIAAGDLDGDGRMDLIATNWGRNLPEPADSANPLFLYAGNFGDVPAVDFLAARYDPRLSTIAPVGGFQRLARAIPSIRRRIPTYAAYADASIEQVIGTAFPRTLRLEMSLTDHLVLLNRGDHFEPRPLPLEAQWAPAFGVVVADFDGDGDEDLFLAQNFSQTELGTPRLDAGRGLLLLGDGTGRLESIPGQRSGIVIYGDQRGAAASDYDADGRIDLAVAQNAGATRLFHNALAKPGLTVRLQGASGNPAGIGAMVRIRYADRWGPARQIRAGGGYWSVDGAVPVLGLREGATPVSVAVRWPGGQQQEVTLAPGQREVRIKAER